MSEKSTGTTSYTLHPIGTVHRLGSSVELHIKPEYRPALATLDKFSHVIVLWWVNGMDTEEYRSKLQCRPPYAAEHLTGVFACRAEYRPNPIALTPCKILGIDEEKGIIRIANIDALDGSPLLDLKAYFPVMDRVQDPHIPDWLEGWPEWLPDGGIGLEYD